MTVMYLKNGIIAALHKSYPGLPVYGERVEQGFSAPAFFVRLEGAGGRREVGRRRRRSAEFDIQFFPAEGGKRNEAMYAVGDALLELFESLETADGLPRPLDARYALADDVLHCFVSFRWFALAAGPFTPTLSAVETEVAHG